MYVSMVDRILSIQPLKEVRAVKNLCFRENYLRDHFPGYPMMPGALQIEAMIQAAQWLLRHSLDFPRADFVPVSVTNSRYAKYVRPGDSLILKVSLLEQSENRFRFRGTGELDGSRTVLAQFELLRYEHGWNTIAPSTADSLITQQRDVFARLTQRPVPHSEPAPAAQAQEA
jgi:3-hydroxyacyl-[acyl-carrier-protein] dehydratase